MDRERHCGWLCAISLFFLMSVLGASHSIAQQSLCAEVRIQIQQRLSLERQAFDAVLRINNGLQGIDVEELSVTLTFVDEDGNPVIGSSNPDNTDASFFIRLDDLDGISAVDGTGVVSAQSSGSARWLIIPAADAGGELPTGLNYGVGATVDYRIGDEEKTIDLIPEMITVRPQPKLFIDYFLPFDVHGDDPFTPEIEPSQIFPLGVRIKNVGFGAAVNLNIESAQPEIIENEQGLLVNFEILGGYVQDEPSSPSLLLNFGNLPPQQSVVGRWEMISSLSGQFRDLEASFTHADTLGGALTSLIANPGGVIPGHRLVKDTIVDLPGRDSVRDFLAYDGGILRVYESEGIDTVVEDLSDTAVIQGNGDGTFSFQFSGSGPSPGSIVYARVPSPLGDAVPDLVVQRGDGSPLPAPNAWVSKTREDDDSWSHHLNLFDAQPQSSYAISPEDMEILAEISGLVFADDGTGDPQAGLPLTGVPVRLVGIVPGGSPVDVLTTTNDDGRFRFGNLQAGTYDLEVATVADHVNGTHVVGSAGGTADGARIIGIELPAGTPASGYGFAKLPASSLPQSDLAILAQGPVATVEPDAVVPIAVALVNHGPDPAQAVEVAVALSAGLTLVDGTPDLGLFDPVTGIWSIDGMPAGSAGELVILVSASAEGAYSIEVTARHATDLVVDPDPGNNTAIVDLVVEESSGELGLAVGVGYERRVLVYAKCVAPDCPVAPIKPQIEGLLDGLDVVEYLVVESEGAFLDELRGGYWNVVWLSGSARPPSSSIIQPNPVALPDRLVQELAAFLMGGHSMLVDGGLSVSPGNRLEAFVGVHQAGSAQGPSAYPVQVDEEALPDHDYQVFGRRYPLQVTDAAELAAFSDEVTAIAEIQRGAGRIITLGFFLVDIDSAVARTALASGLLDRLVVEPGEEVGVRDYATITAAVGDEDRDGQFDVTMQLPVGMIGDLFVSARPAPVTSLPAPQVSWSGEFLPEAWVDHSAVMKVSDGPSNREITVTLADIGEDRQTSKIVSFAVMNATQFIDRSRTELSQIELDSQVDLAAKAAALAFLDDALIDSDQEHYGEAITGVFQAINKMMSISGADMSMVLRDAGAASRVLHRYLPLPASACRDQIEGGTEDIEGGDAADAADDEDGAGQVACGSGD